MVKDAKFCSVTRACRICRFNSHKGRNLYIDYVSTVVEKDICRCYSLRELP